MNTCDKCKANKVCDHNLWGFETCNNFIPESELEHFADTLWDNLKYARTQDIDLEFEIYNLLKEFGVERNQYESYYVCNILFAIHASQFNCNLWGVAYMYSDCKSIGSYLC